MAPDEPTNDGPSIAPPSLGFGLRRRKKGAAAPEPDAVTDAPERAAEADPTPVAEPEPLVVPESAPRADPPAPEPVRQTPAPAPVVTPTASPPPVVEATDSTRTARFTPSPSVGRDVPPAAEAPTEVLAATGSRGGRGPKAARAPKPVKVPGPPAQPGVEEEPRQPRARRDLTAPPWFNGRSAAMATGLVVGLVVVLATAGTLRLCEAVRGTPSCGGAGFFLLVAILVVGVLIGSFLLRLAGVPDPASTSFLAVGLMAVVALLILVGSIFEWWMIIAIPLVCVGTFALSHLVTTSFVEGTDS